MTDSCRSFLVEKVLYYVFVFAINHRTFSTFWFGSDSLDGAGRWMRKRTYQKRERRGTYCQQLPVVCLGSGLFGCFVPNRKMRSCKMQMHDEKKKNNPAMSVLFCSIGWMDGHAKLFRHLHRGRKGKEYQMIPDSEYCMHALM